MTTASVQHTEASAAEARAFAATYADTERTTSQRAGTTAQIVGDVHRLNISGGVQTASVEAGHYAIGGEDHAPIRSPDSSSNIVTARSTGGRNLLDKEIGPDSIINVGGMETNVRAALIGGLIRHNAAGVLEYADGMSPTAEPAAKVPQLPPAQPDSADALGERLSDAAENIIETDVAHIGATDRAGAIHEMMQTGTLTDDMANRIASSRGITPDEVRGRAKTLFDAYATQARGALGPQADQIVEWAKTNAMDALKQAEFTHVNEGTTTGYADLASRYMENLPTIDPNRILTSPVAKAIGARREKDGSISIVHPNHGRVDWKVAVRTGLVQPR